MRRRSTLEPKSGLPKNMTQRRTGARSQSMVSANLKKMLEAATSFRLLPPPTLAFAAQDRGKAPVKGADRKSDQRPSSGPLISRGKA